MSIACIFLLSCASTGKYDKFTYGTIDYDGYVYTGYLSNGKPNGDGTALFSDKTKITGKFSNGNYE